MNVTLVDSTAFNIALLDAMCNVNEDVAAYFNITCLGKDTQASVEATVKVNGIEVPFTESLYKAVNESVAVLESQYEQRVRKAALHLVSRSKYCNLYNTMHNAEYLIEEELDKLGMLE